MRYYAFDGTKNIMVDQTPLGLLRIVVSIGRISTFFPTGYNWLQLVKGGQGATLRSNITALDAKGRLFFYASLGGCLLRLNQVYLDITSTSARIFHTLPAKAGRFLCRGE